MICGSAHHTAPSPGGPGKRRRTKAGKVRNQRSTTNSSPGNMIEDGSFHNGPFHSYSYFSTCTQLLLMVLQLLVHVLRVYTVRKCIPVEYHYGSRV